jgi:hypothetical protein
MVANLPTLTLAEMPAGDVLLGHIEIQQVGICEVPRVVSIVFTEEPWQPDVPAQLQQAIMLQ